MSKGMRQQQVLRSDPLQQLIYYVYKLYKRTQALANTSNTPATSNLSEIGTWQAKAKPKAKAKEAKTTPAATPAPVAKVPPPPAAAKVPPAMAKVPPPVAAVPSAAAKALPAGKMPPPTAAVKVPPSVVAAKVAPVQPVQPLQQMPRPVPTQVAEAKKAPEGNRSGALNGINGEVKQSVNSGLGRVVWSAGWMCPKPPTLYVLTDLQAIDDGCCLKQNRNGLLIEK